MAAELAKNELHLIINNHILKAVWRCSPDDGSGWFGDIYFDVTKWKRALE